jgi:uncharacterized membrane protein
MPAGLCLALSVLRVSGLLVSVLVVSGLAGALTFVVSPPPSDKLRSPACAAADTKTNPAIRMNLRMVVSPLEVWAETMRGERFVM